MKLVIGGGARCGKTTLADHLARCNGLPVYHADDLLSLGWREASDAFADVIAFGRDGIYEGVAATRALRKLLARSRARPCTMYVHLNEPFVGLTDQQRTMNIGAETVFRTMIRPLHRRGVTLTSQAEGWILTSLACKGTPIRF